VPSSASRNRAAPAPIDELQAVRKNRRYEQVAEQIQGLIARGVLKPGDRLPAERDLVSKFGVGRGSIRDAIRTLEVMGIVEPRQGHGTVVRELSADSLVVPLASVLSQKRHLVSELLDVRRVVGLFLEAPERGINGNRIANAGEWSAHLLLAFVCVEEMTTGPCGGPSALMHRPWLDSLKVSAPAFTSSSVTIHCTMMQGLGVGGTVGS